MKNKTIIVVLLMLLIIGSGILLKVKFASLKEAPKTQEQKERVLSVTADTVVYSVVPSSVTATGRVLSTSEVPLVAEAAGRIETADVSLKIGAAFKKGDKLLTIYKDEAELALIATKSNFLKLLATALPDIKIDYPEVYPQYANFFKLIDLKTDLPELPTVNDVRFKTYIASKGILSAYYAILQSELKLKRYTIVAPFDGVFLMVQFEAGAYVNAGVTVGKLIRTDEIEVEIPVEKGFAQFITVGDEVLLKRTERGKAVAGKVVRKAAFLDETTQSVKVYVNVATDNNDPLLRGEYLYASFDGHVVEDGFELNRNAIFNFNEVFVVVNNRLKKTTVNLLKVDNTVAIVNGLPKGSIVVNEPLVGVQENSLVKVISRQ